ncbi:uncharacterized protein LOC128301731 isoform X4 [Anopheles moucheti]|uniref:uncharacterized protein LOC128301731 isoform X4 n=1 Tax=Anopheles moucheti TaxID=186751 RepID=UPI0022F0AA65|nr:uncharacterized protein LOC128301731 isoform X4 [Anopheles moucheti]
MSKRLKYAKLRLVKPLNAADPPSIVVPVKTDVCTDRTVVVKTSNFSDTGAKESCTSEETFILIPSENSGENNEITNEQSTRRKTQNPPNASSNDGPKFPKLKKKSCEGNRLMAWCAVPLHISFFNLVSESNVLQRQILQYKPFYLDEVNGLLKQAGLRYETNDLIAFFDKHCIAFRIAASCGDGTSE